MSNSETMDIATKIRFLRRKHKLTQRELAYNLETTERTICRWEGGVCVPQARWISKLEKLFKVKF